MLTLNAITVAREVFLPLQPHFLALHGLSKLLQTIELVAAAQSGSALTGVVMCMYDAGTRLAAEVCSDVDEFLAVGPIAAGCGREPAVFRRVFVATSGWPKSAQLWPIDLPVRAAQHGTDYHNLAA